MTRGNGTGQSRNGPHSWGERWTKVYENALTDTKYLAIAHKTGAPRLLIGATFTELLLYTGTHHPDTGSFEGFDVRFWATWTEASVELIEQVIEGMREFGLLAGNTIANWATRQGKNSIAAAEKVVSAGALRQRRYRARKAEETCRAHSEECAQPPGPNPETHDPGCASRASEEASPSVTLGVTAGVTLTVEEEGEAQKEKEVFKKTRDASGRDAPLCEPQSSEKVVRLSDREAAQKAKLKAKKKDLRRHRVFEYVLATFHGEEQERRLYGLQGYDEAHDGQWWFDHLDAEMHARNWNGCRDRAAARKREKAT
jgi:hypothetical protein